MSTGIFLIGWVFALFGMYLGYKMGYEEGHENGYNLAKITYMIVIDGYRRRLGLEEEDKAEKSGSLTVFAVTAKGRSEKHGNHRNNICTDIRDLYRI